MRADLVNEPDVQSIYERFAHQYGRVNVIFTFDEAVAYALGEQPPTPSFSPTTAPPEQPPSGREHEVAKIVAQGMPNKDIASALVIAQRTAESHVEHILTKLAFTSRAQIAAWITEQ